MKNRFVIDLLWIVVLYAIYFVLVFLIATPEYQVLEELEVFPPLLLDGTLMTPENFYYQFEGQAQVALGLSLLATLAWYILGQWGPKPHSMKASAWVLLWMLGVAFALGGGLFIYFYYPVPSLNGGLMLAFLAGSALVFYYLATVLLSPVGVKFIPPGSKLLRRGW